MNDNGNDDYCMPKKGNIRLLKYDNFLTIIEGIGTAFLNMDEANSWIVENDVNYNYIVKKKVKKS